MRLLIALVHESFTTSILAGLLTYSVFERPSHPILSGQWHWVLFKNFGRAYSSGSVQDLHLIPFSSLFRRIWNCDTKTDTKVIQID